MLTNLLCNAIQAVHAVTAGQVTVTVAGTREGHVEFGVTDNGCGIAVAHQPELFVPFYHRPSSTANTRSFPGCGLGLCLCSHLVRLMGCASDSCRCCICVHALVDSFVTFF